MQKKQASRLDHVIPGGPGLDLGWNKAKWEVENRW